eukprot:g17155.t1
MYGVSRSRPTEGGNSAVGGGNYDRSVESSFQQLLMEHILPLASRRRPASISDAIRDSLVRDLLQHYRPALREIFRFYAVCPSAALHSSTNNISSGSSGKGTSSARSSKGAVPLTTVDGAGEKFQQQPADGGLGPALQSSQSPNPRGNVPASAEDSAEVDSTDTNVAAASGATAPLFSSAPASIKLFDADAPASEINSAAAAAPQSSLPHRTSQHPSSISWRSFPQEEGRTAGPENGTDNDAQDGGSFGGGGCCERIVDGSRGASRRRVTSVKSSQSTATAQTAAMNSMADALSHKCLLYFTADFGISGALLSALDVGEAFLSCDGRLAETLSGKNKIDKRSSASTCALRTGLTRAGKGGIRPLTFHEFLEVLGALLKGVKLFNEEMLSRWRTEGFLDFASSNIIDGGTATSLGSVRGAPQQGRAAEMLRNMLAFEKGTVEVAEEQGGGGEPEAGDTLLMITLKLGMEEHAKSVLETPTLSLGIRNSSGRDAARIAASCGRESLMISKLQVQALGEAQRQGPTKARDDSKEEAPWRTTCTSRLGMRNLLDDQGITMVVERVPRNTSGLITQDELQQFADRPAGLPWAPHRGSSDHVQGYEDVRDVKFGLGFSVLLHELQANAVPRARGEFPWKKSPKDRSSVSLFVRITRGPHVVESTPVVSSWSPLDGDISDAKRSAAGWSWQWKETLRVPGLFQNETRRTERAAGDEEDEREERSAGPLVVAANNNEGCPPKIQQSSEAVSTSVVVSGGDADDVNLRGDSDPSSSCEVGTTVDPHRGDSTDSSGSRRVSESTVEDQQTSEGPAVAEASFPKADGSEKKQRGPFFWSPRRGRRNTKAAAGKKQSSGFPASHHGNGGAVRTTPDVALITAGNDRSVNNNNSGSSSDADTSELDKQRQPGATRSLRRRSARRSTSSGQICPEVLVKANDTVISGLGFATGRVNADANDGETRKKTVRFWGPGRRRGRRNHAESGDPAIDEHDSQQSVLSRCDSEASTVFDISDPGENGDGRAAANTGKIEGPAVPDDEPSIVSVPQDSPRKKARSSSFWSPRRKGNKDAKKTEEDSDAHGGDESGGTATTGPRILGETTNRASHSWGKSAGRRRRAPPKASATTSEDVMLLEVWEVKGAAVTSPCAKKNEESSVSAPECGDGQTMAGSPRARDSEEPDSYNRPHLGGTEDASPRPGSGKEPLPEQTPEHAQPLGATVETGTGPTPATENNLDHPAIGSKAADIDVLVATGEGGVEDDRERAIGDDVSAAANGPPVAAGGATSTKTSRRKLTFLFTSPLKKVGRAKGEMPSAIPHPRSPVTSSETETPLASLSLDPGKVITSTEGGQQEEATPDEQGVRETSEAALHPETSNVPEERSNDDEDDNEADGSYTPSQAQRSRIAASFFSAYKGINTATTKESPRSAAKPKPVLWGRMTIRVADVLGRSVSHGHHLVGRQNVPTRDGSDAAERVSSSNRVPFQSPAQRSRASIEAGSLMNVTIDAPLYDPSLIAGGGCDPAGCVGDLTRDRDMKPTSRWSCSLSLGDIGSICSITYTLGNSSMLEALKVAMYKGDSRIVNVDIFVDEEKQKSWTSSGTTTDFERIELSATGKTIELRGVLAESEWLSITEVEIMVLQDDGATPAPSASPTTATTPPLGPTYTGDSYTGVTATTVPTTAPSSTMAPFAARDTAGAPTSLTPTAGPVEPIPAAVDVAVSHGGSAHSSGGILFATFVGTAVGLASMLPL